jgi:hypothetical protein
VVRIAIDVVGGALLKRIALQSRRPDCRRAGPRWPLWKVWTYSCLNAFRGFGRGRVAPRNNQTRPQVVSTKHLKCRAFYVLGVDGCIKGIVRSVARLGHAGELVPRLWNWGLWTRGFLAGIIRSRVGPELFDAW